MFTERSLRQHPAVIKAFMGLPAAAFWELIEKIKEQLPAYEAQRLERANRQRSTRLARLALQAELSPPCGTDRIPELIRLHLVPAEISDVVVANM